MKQKIYKSFTVFITVLIYCLATSVFFHTIGMDKISGNHEGGCHPSAHAVVSSAFDTTQSNNYDCFDECFSHYAHTVLTPTSQYKKITVNELPCVDFLDYGIKRNDLIELIGWGGDYHLSDGNNDQVFISQYVGIIKQIE